MTLRNLKTYIELLNEETVDELDIYEYQDNHLSNFGNSMIHVNLKIKGGIN